MAAKETKEKLDDLNTTSFLNAPHSRLICRENSPIDYKRPSHRCPQTPPQHTRPFLPHTLPKTIHNPIILTKRRLRLNPRLHHIQRITTHPAGNPSHPPSQDHCP
ncbi:hypothetical protein STAS_29870 [Striga asiatica]|uniref:Uncharacterized protein n=1 Tax=Striga asiatica TaxID=4170 RepID=A0A5A7R7U0_STRAF|nr:hypothetical protein STAS_29870 [Striga asiatica]